MKNYKKTLILISTSLLLSSTFVVSSLSIVSCTKEVKVQSIQWDTFKNPNALTPLVNGSDKLCASVTYKDGSQNSDDVFFTSSNNSIATINEKGEIEYLAEGEVTFTAAAKNDVNESLSSTIKVRVPGSASATVSDMTISLESTLIQPVVGTEADLIATVEYGDSTSDNLVAYTSSQNDIATIDQNGHVTFNSEGVVTFIAISNIDHTKTATWTCNVAPKNEKGDIGIYGQNVIYVNQDEMNSDLEVIYETTNQDEVISDLEWSLEIKDSENQLVTNNSIYVEKIEDSNEAKIVVEQNIIDANYNLKLSCESSIYQGSIDIKFYSGIEKVITTGTGEIPTDISLDKKNDSINEFSYKVVDPGADEIYNWSVSFEEENIEGIRISAKEGETTTGILSVDPSLLNIGNHQITITTWSQKHFATSTFNVGIKEEGTISGNNKVFVHEDSPEILQYTYTIDDLHKGTNAKWKIQVKDSSGEFVDVDDNSVYINQDEISNESSVTVNFNRNKVNEFKDEVIYRISYTSDKGYASFLIHVYGKNIGEIHYKKIEGTTNSESSPVKLLDTSGSVMDVHFTNFIICDEMSNTILDERILINLPHGESNSIDSLEILNKITMNEVQYSVEKISFISSYALFTTLNEESQKALKDISVWNNDALVKTVYQFENIEKDFQTYVNNLIIDEGITQIGKNCFHIGCSDKGGNVFSSFAVNNIQISAKIETIEPYQFAGMLEDFNSSCTVIIPSSVTSIGEGAFASAYNNHKSEFDSAAAAPTKKAYSKNFTSAYGNGPLAGLTYSFKNTSPDKAPVTNVLWADDNGSTNEGYKTSKCTSIGHCAFLGLAFKEFYFPWALTDLGAAIVSDLKGYKPLGDTDTKLYFNSALPTTHKFDPSNAHNRGCVINDVIFDSDSVTMEIYVGSSFYDEKKWKDIDWEDDGNAFTGPSFHKWDV